jgi:hypothetical protein
MYDLTHIVDGERIWYQDRASSLLQIYSISVHELIIKGLTEATKQTPSHVQDYLVFALDPIVIEVRKELQIVSLISEKRPRRDFGYSRWKDLFSIIRTYWLSSNLNEQLTYTPKFL